MKNKCFFKIIIPVYNCEKYIEKCIKSIENQTFQDFSIVIIDDVSTDNSPTIIKNLCNQYSNVISLFIHNKVWNGGARNIGINTKINSQYTLFIDSDDWLSSNDCLEYLYNLIKENNYPDCIRMNYNLLKDKQLKEVKFLEKELSPQKLLKSLSVAVWTKCVKTELVTYFPEETLMEDEIQHISQCDNIENVILCKKPIITWNRDNVNSCSTMDKKTNPLYDKWNSSIYRFLADLIDLKCKHNYCEEYRLQRIKQIKNIIKETIDE